MNTPILETDRLILRPFQENDVNDVFECWESDPDVAKYMFWTSHNDIEKTREWVSFELGQIEKSDWYRFAIELKDTNTLIGTALIYYEGEVECWEIGYNLGKNDLYELFNRRRKTKDSCVLEAKLELVFRKGVVMSYNSEKQQIVLDNPELVLRENGDFKIKSDLVERYEIIDMHCHLFSGLSQLFPSFLQKEKFNEKVSLMDMSCFPFLLGLFDLNRIYFTNYPTKLLSADGIKTRIKLFSGALVLNYATVERLIMDMDANHIVKAVVQQINPPNKTCATVMDDIVKNNDRLYTFGSIHPFDDNILSKIDNYMKMDIKGWKLNPHIWGVPIDCEESITLLKELAKTKLPIMSCSGIGLPQEMLDSDVPTKQTKKEVMTQHLPKFKKVLECIPDATVILAHSGCFDFEYMIDIMKKFPNIYTDISIQPAANIKKLIGEIGSERILFGTDYPFVSQAFSILSVLRATDIEQDRINIFSNNAKKILGV